MDSSQLEQLKVVCIQLDDTKVTARKKAEDQLRHSLNNERIILALNNASERDGSHWRWQDVYRTTHNFVKKETDKMIQDLQKESQAKPSASAVTSRENRKKSVMGLFKLVVRKGKSSLTWPSVITDLLGMMAHPFIRNTFADDLLTLLTEVVTNSASRAKISVARERNQWADLLTTVLDTLEDPPERLESMAVSRLLHLTLHHGTVEGVLRSVVRTERMWRVMRDVLLSDKMARHDSHTKLECLKAANCLVRSSCLEQRRECARLGEDVTRAVIMVWSDWRQESMEAVLEFLKLQMIVHHPGGQCEVEAGALYGDREVWTCQLRRILKNILQTTIIRKQKQNKQKNSRQVEDFRLPAGLAKLGASVIYQLAQVPVTQRRGDVTQLVELDESQAASQASQANPAKRRRLEEEEEEERSGLDLLVRELLRPTVVEEQKVPWLEVVEEVVRSQPALLAGRQEELTRLLTAQLTESRAGGVREEVAGLLALVLPLTTAGLQDWAALGQSVATLLATNQLRERGHNLLRVIINQSAAFHLNIKDIYRPYRNRILTLDTHSVTSLIMVLERFPSWDPTVKQTRLDIVDWISDQLMAEKCPLAEFAQPSLIGKLLHKLSLKLSSSLEMEDCRVEASLGDREELEEQLTLLGCQETLPSPPVSQERTERPGEAGVRLSSVVARVEEMMVRVGGHLLDNLQPGTDLTTVHQLRLCSAFLSCLLELLSLGGEEEGRLAHFSQGLVSKILETTGRMFRSREEKITVRPNIIAVLEFTRANLTEQPSHVRSLRNLLRNKTVLLSFTETLQREIAELCQAREKSPAVRSTQSSASTSQSNATVDSFDDFDDMDTEDVEDNEDFDMSSSNDPSKDIQEQRFACECLRLMAALAPVSGTEGQTVKILQKLLRTFQFCDPVMDSILPTLKLLSASFDEEVLDIISRVLMEVTQTFVTRDKFITSGVLTLCQVLEFLVPWLGQHETYTRDVSVKILTGLVSQNLRTKGARLSGQVLTSLCLVTGQLLQLGGAGAWAVWGLHNQSVPAQLAVNTDQHQLISLSLPGFLLSPFPAVRLAAIRLLFSHLSQADNRLGELDRLNLLTVVESDLSPGLSHSALLALLTKVDSTTASRVLGLSLKLFSTNNIDLQQLQRAAGLISKHCGYQKVEEMVLKFLPALLLGFLEEDDVNIKNFPIVLLGYSKHQFDLFVKEQEAVVVPILLYHSPTEECLKVLANVLRKRSSDIIKNNFHHIALLFLPGLAASEFNLRFADAERSKDLADFIQEKFGDDFTASLAGNMKVLGPLYLNVNDPAALANTFGINQPERFSTNPPELTAKLPGHILRLMDENVLKMIGETNPEGLVKTTVTITARVRCDSTDSSLQETLQGLHSLHLWLESLISSFCPEIRPVIPFLTQYLSYRLLTFLSQTSSSDVTKISLSLLSNLLQFSLETDHTAVLPVFLILHYSLVSFIRGKKKDAVTTRLAVGILENLVVTHGHRFDCVMESLEDYPDLEEFRKLQRELRGARQLDSSLSAHITRLLELLDQTGRDCSHLLWPLVVIREKLEISPTAISDLDRDQLRRFLAKLLRIVRETEGGIREEAVKCLAEIGAVDLASEILEEESESSVEVLPTILRQLADILLTSSGDLATRASRSLINILSSEEGKIWLSTTDDDVCHLKKFLIPFRKLQSTAKASVGFSLEMFNRTVDQNSLWTDSGSSHEEWIINLVTAMLESSNEGSVYRYLLETCQVSSSLCEEVFPFLINDLLKNNPDIGLAVSKRLCDFFENHFERQTEVPCQRTESVRVMLSAVLHLRLDCQSSNSWRENFKISELNYLHCATAALHCGQHFSALLMCQLWCLKQGINCSFGTKKHDFEESLLERIASLRGSEARKVQNIIFTASRQIGDTDRALGVGRMMVDEPLSRISLLTLEGRSESALPLYDCLLAGREGEREEAGAGLVRSLQSQGLHHTLHQYLSALPGPALRPEQQECSWRLERWEEVSPDLARGSVSGCVLAGLDSLVRREPGDVTHWAKLGTGLVCQELQLTSLDTTGTVYPLLAQLRQLSELVRLSSPPPALEETLTLLSHKDDIPCPAFSLLEPTLTQRLIAVSHLAPGQLDSQTVRVSKLARRAGMVSVCNQLERFYQRMTPSVRLEKASAIYQQGHRQEGILLVKRILREVENQQQHQQEEQVELRSDVYFTLGHWLHQQKSEPSSRILEDYLQKTVTILEDSPSQSSQQFLVDSYMAVASFADKLYIQTRDFINSSEFKERTEAAKKVKAEADILKKAAARTNQKDLKQANIIKERFSNLDNDEVDYYSSQCQEYLQTALHNYLSVLSLGDKPLAVYRLVSLWFSDSNCDNPEVCQLLHRRLPDVSSSKFIPLLYQLAARVQLPKSKPTEFSSILYSLMVRCVRDHPHHGIPIALSLVNAKEDEKFVVENQNARTAANKENDPRAAALSKLISELEKTPLKTIVQKYKVLCRSLISLAYLEVKDTKVSKFSIPSSQEVMKIKDWTDIPILTDTIPVRPDGDYSNSVKGIAKYENVYTMVGGVNAPKKIGCLGTDGRCRPQLVKGKDDLRQDAVMEQVFGLLNQLLGQNPQTVKRKLTVKTYKVVPLSQRSGVLEWCQNTQPMAEYLMGRDNRSGAHKKYNPKEWDSLTCRKEMAKVAKHSHSKKMEMFMRVCSNFSPAMKYFFLENFSSPVSYYQSMTAYTRSVATNSMVGHILGLGDRHTNNILIDNNTGEIIHIDLGIAFDQGKILPTPETIPFRLTRDMVDGFGASGVEGVFRQCCEHSLRVLRDNSSAVMTVLEVLLHDPLYNWSVGPSKAAARQEAGQWEELQERGGNKMANRALLVLSAKLEGREEGAALSVEGQVTALIQRATDPANLCAVFDGWAAWC